MSSPRASLRSSPRPSRLALIVLAALASIPPARAADASWTLDADGAWSDAANWNPAAAPGDTAGLASTDVATFNTPLTDFRVITIDANRNIAGITFNQTSAFAYTLAGGPLLLSSGGFIQATNSSGTHQDLIAAPIVIQGDGGTASFNGATPSTTQDINFTGDISGVSTDGNTTLLTIEGSNAKVYLLNGLISDGTAGGKLAIVKRGTGLWRINNGSNTFSGGVTSASSTGGSLTFGASSTPTTGTVTSGPAGTGTITFSGGFVQTGGNFTLANPIFVTADTTTNVRGTISNNITLTGPVTGTGVFQNNHTSSSSAIIQGDITGFTGTFSHTTNNNGNQFTFNGDTAASQDGSAARFLLAGTGTNRGLNIGNAAAPLFQMGELSGTGGRIVPNTTGVTLQVGALNTRRALPFAGAITGDLALTKVGDGNLILSGTNPYTGNTTVAGGTLRVAGSLASSAVSVASGAALSGDGTLSGILTLDSGATLRADAGTSGALTVGGLVLNGSVSLTLDGASPTAATGQIARVLNYSGSISGSGGFSTAAGLRNATIDTSVAGQIDLTFDTKDLTWSGDNAAWDLATSANWNSGSETFHQGDVLTFDDTAPSKTLALSGSVYPGAITFNNSIGNDYVIAGDGVIGGSSALTLNGTGSVTLAGHHAYTGGTNINAGTLIAAGLSGPVAINTTGTLSVSDTDSLAGITSLALNSGGTLQLRTDAAATFASPTVTLSSGGNATIDIAPLTTGSPAPSLGTVKFTGTGTVTSTLNVTGASGSSLSLASVAIENNSSATTNSHTKLVLKPTTAELTVGAVTASGPGAQRDTDIILDGTGTGRITGRVSNPASSWTFLTKQGSGTWILSASSGYSGTTAINDSGGILRLDHFGAIGTNTVQSWKGGTRTGTLQLNMAGNNTFARNFNSASSSTFGSGGTATIQNLQGNTTLSGNYTINGTGGSGMNIQSDAGGTMKLTGTLSNNVANSNRLFDLGGDGNGEVSGLIKDGTNAGAVTSLMKEGTGTWTITGANTYTGNTTVGGGTLVVTSTGTLGTSRLLLANGATLDVSATAGSTFAAPTGLGGSGVLNATGKTVIVSGPFTPGQLAISAPVTLDSNSTTTFTASESSDLRSAASIAGPLQNGGTLLIAPAVLSTTPSTTYHTFVSGQTYQFATASGGIIPGYTGVSVNEISVNETGDPVATPLGLAPDTVSPGTWNATSTTGLIYTYTEDTATLVVSGSITAITPLQAWRNTYFPIDGNDGTGIGAPDADPDSDGITNLVEYATNTSPVAFTAPVISLGTDAGRLTLTFPRIDDPALVYTVQGSNDLTPGSWTEVTEAAPATNNPSFGFVGATPDVTETESETVIDSVVVSPAQPRRFLRLHISLTP